jgi:hypothetical protein
MDLFESLLRSMISDCPILSGKPNGHPWYILRVVQNLSRVSD